MAAGIYPPRERPVEPTTNVGECEMEINDGKEEATGNVCIGKDSLNKTIVATYSGPFGRNVLLLDWFDKREWLEIEFCRVYAEE